MKTPLVTVIIVNWNGERLLVDGIGSLEKSTYKNLEILFVDNASVDGSVSYVKNNFPHIKIFQNKTNLGYAQGHEEALQKAKGELVLLLSTDVIMEKDTIAELVKGMLSHENAGAIMPKLLMYPQKDLIDSVGAFFLWTGFLYHFGREKDAKDPKFDNPMEIYSGKGACLLFKKLVLRQTGLFDKDYFAYFEDTDLCHRIWLTGHSVWYWPYSQVYHKGGTTSKKLAPSFIYFHDFKNRIMTHIKNLSIQNLLIVLPQLFIVYQCAFCMYLIKGNFVMAWVVQHAIIWNVMNMQKILKKRSHIQKNIRKVSDDFLPKVSRPVRLSYYYYLAKGLRYYKD